MGTTTSVGGGNKHIAIYGDGTVSAGNGNDTITIGGYGSVIAGNGNDSITIYAQEEPTETRKSPDHDTSSIQIGHGHDTINFFGDGTVHQTGSSGHDTINLGFGNDTIFEAGRATVHGVFGDASVVGGALAFTNTATTHIESAMSGKATLIGGQFTNEFVGGSGTTVMKGGFGNDTFIGGTGHESMTGGSGHNLFAFVEAGGKHIVTNFVSGQDKLYLEGYSLSYLKSHGDISVTGHTTTITLDGGATVVELKGVTNLSASDITKHKP